MSHVPYAYKEKACEGLPILTHTLGARQEDGEFEVFLGYTLRVYLKATKKLQQKEK